MSFFWVSNQYIKSVNRENIYKHLASTLTTFNTFYETAGSEHKSIILLEAAKILFPPPKMKYDLKHTAITDIVDTLKIAIEHEKNKSRKQ